MDPTQNIALREFLGLGDDATLEDAIGAALTKTSEEIGSWLAGFEPGIVHGLEEENEDLRRQVEHERETAVERARGHAVRVLEESLELEIRRRAGAISALKTIREELDPHHDLDLEAIRSAVSQVIGSLERRGS